jgi:hypothetical protein
MVIGKDQRVVIESHIFWIASLTRCNDQKANGNFTIIRTIPNGQQLSSMPKGEREKDDL